MQSAEAEHFQKSCGTYLRRQLEQPQKQSAELQQTAVQGATQNLEAMLRRMARSQQNVLQVLDGGAEKCAQQSRSGARRTNFTLLAPPTPRVPLVPAPGTQVGEHHERKTGEPKGVDGVASALSGCGGLACFGLLRVCPSGGFAPAREKLVWVPLPVLWPHEQRQLLLDETVQYCKQFSHTSRMHDVTRHPVFCFHARYHSSLLQDGTCRKTCIPCAVSASLGRIPGTRCGSQPPGVHANRGPHREKEGSGETEGGRHHRYTHPPK